MITHFHIRLQLPDTEPAIYRDVILPDSVLLGDLNLIISTCFGWPLTDAFEFVPQQTATTYLGNTASFVNSQHTLEADNVPVAFVFQKNLEIRYYCGTKTSDQVAVTMLSTKSLLPDPVFKLEHYQGENRPCSWGGTPFIKQKVIDDLQLLREDLYLLPDEFDYEHAITPDLTEPFNILEELRKADTVSDAAEILKGLPESEAISLIGQLMDEFRTQMDQTFTLEECLSMLNKDSLADIMRCNHLKGFSKLRRGEIEEILLEKLTSPEFLKEQFRTLTIPEIGILDTLCQHNIPFDTQDASLHSEYLLRHGLCYTDDTGLYLTLPEELRPLYQQLIQDETFMMDVQFYDMLHTFCYTAVYFYGVYPIRHLLRKISETMQMVIPLTDLEEIVGPVMQERHDYVLRDGWIIAAELAQDDPETQNALEQLKAIQNQRTDFFWPDLDQMEPLVFLRRLADEDLYAEFTDSFSKYLNDNLNLELAMANIEYLIRSNLPLENVLMLATSELFVPPDQKTAEAMYELLIQIYNRTPMWSLGGYTPEQMKEKRKKTAPKNSGKIISLKERRERKNK